MASRLTTYAETSVLVDQYLQLFSQTSESGLALVYLLESFKLRRHQWRDFIGNILKFQ